MTVRFIVDRGMCAAKVLAYVPDHSEQVCFCRHLVLPCCLCDQLSLFLQVASSADWIFETVSALTYVLRLTRQGACSSLRNRLDCMGVDLQTQCCTLVSHWGYAEEMLGIAERMFLSLNMYGQHV